MPCRKKPAADIPPTADIPPSGDIPPLPPTLLRGKPTRKTASSHSTTLSKLSHASLTKTNKTTPANKKLAAGSRDTKKWQYPHAMDKGFATYINHGCVLDRQGYPLYPNGSTTFVRPTGTSITNFGAVGFSRICSNGAKSIPSDWKVVRMYCLGVLQCDQDGCDYVGPPPTEPKKISQLLSR
jgi:hypothetical protein